MLVDEDFFIEDLEEIWSENEKTMCQIEKENQIVYEFNLYKWFCRLCNIKMCYFSSLCKFMDYCKQNSIQLI